jgi:hypothetical protein
MRKDMAKVIVERPRRGRFVEPSVNHRYNDLDALPFYEGIQAGRRRGWNRKELNENLSPLRRYLVSQVGRPWNDVFSEIAANINVNSTVQNHVRDHLFDYVDINTYRDEQGIVRMSNGKGWHSIFGYEVTGLYVDPDDGTLQITPDKPREKYDPFAPRDGYIPFGYERAYQRLNGVWFEVFYTLLPDTKYEHYRDENGHIRARAIHPTPGFDVVNYKWSTPEIYPKKNRFAHAKRPLTTKEIKAAGLTDEWFS